MENLIKTSEEFELKYIINNSIGNENLLKQILTIFSANGFKVISTTEKQNSDEYFDTMDLMLYEQGGSLRIRETIEGDKIKFKGTYKMPLGEGEVYSSRTEIEESLLDANFTSFELKMKETGAPIDFSKIIRSSILNSTTKRTNIVLEKSGVRVCLSLDRSTYTNHFLDELITVDKMIEIETISELNNRTVLNEIHNFITHGIDNLVINKQSKYERGIDSTVTLHNYLQLKESNPKTYTLLKKFNNKWSNCKYSFELS